MGKIQAAELSPQIVDTIALDLEGTSYKQRRSRQNSKGSGFEIRSLEGSTSLSVKSLHRVGLFFAMQKP